ncbi:hypothetical protein HGRIS_014261 [Hohenbuehelia grisea]|uniref:Multidrug resistance-associated ABC transporter n=1 Tax=Hohenbuehelia grisea TaxID=104357 RepID=A0ABR3JT36_9AGAR
MYNPFRPTPAPPGFAGDSSILPEENASWLSLLTFHWLTEFLSVGFSRPLEEDDLWAFPLSKQATEIADRTEQLFYLRCPPENRPQFMQTTNPEKSLPDEGASGVHSSSSSHHDDHPTESQESPETSTKPLYDSSLFKALYHLLFARWWIAGVLELIGETLKTTAPLVTKVLLTWLAESFIYNRSPSAVQDLLPKPKGVGYGIGLAFAFFAMQEGSSLMVNHSAMIKMANGMLVRSAITGTILRKSLRLSGRARAEHSVGKITTMISTDSQRIEELSMVIHSLWVSPIQIILGLGLLIWTLGYSALVGLGVLIFGMPTQLILIMVVFKQRKKGVKITDMRMRTTTEVLQGIRFLKMYGWDTFYKHQIESLRKREIDTVRKSGMAISAMTAIMAFVPIVATILSFITYALTGHDLNVAVIFASLGFFNALQIPLAMFPFALGYLADSLVAFTRISGFLTAEELAQPYRISAESSYAIDADGDFTWEAKVAEPAAEKDATSKSDGTNQNKPPKQAKDSNDVEQRTGGEVENAEGSAPSDEQPFDLKDLRLQVPKGSFVAVVGRVGSGKSSLLQALIGEMRKTRGNVSLGGRVSYVPQTAWIKNASVRENITFGQPFVEDRFKSIVQACSLDYDLNSLPHGDATEIGEKGINISGGQKARISLARAAYSDTDIVLLDDPLSAVDAYVGKKILEKCLLSGPLAQRTRFLVTHALHVLDSTDYIYVMDQGRIAEQGTYQDLLSAGGVFSQLIEEYGKNEGQDAVVARGNRVDQPGTGDDPKDNSDTAVLMQVEERYTGAVSWSIYVQYFRYGGGIFWAPLILGLLILSQVSIVGTSVFLGFWTSSSIPGFRQGDYMAVYAGFGAAHALFSMLLFYSFVVAGLTASLNLFKAALSGVLRSPISFFDTTPLGRIISRLSKDQDTLDNQIPMTIYFLLTVFSSLFGTAGLVFYTFPLLGIIFAPMLIIYYGTAVYYRRTSIETKRLSSLLRSGLYASYSETLTGLSTIRAYRVQSACITKSEQRLDHQNRAAYMTVAIQRWLAVRLDLMGNILVLGICLFAAGRRNAVDPSKVGVVLTYAVGVTQILGEMINQFASNEQNMNAVERMLVYADLPSEGELTTHDDPPPTWPSRGEVTFSAVDFAYRPGLPLVLKNVSFNAQAGEKIGIVGRTGAGKSSLIHTLFRVTELTSGKIEIDGVNTSKIGLHTLRTKLALVPQDSTLFLGTLRENLDPLQRRTDAELLSILQRAWLLPPAGQSDPVAEAKFSLDSTVGDEGSNFSAGERQLLSLCRALVKNSKIIVLDEATSNVDLETDAKLQRTIQTEFASATLLCIAHRLNTIAYYDRVLVMDNGAVAEFDTVLNLFDREDSIFRSLCDEASLSRTDIVRIREGSQKP